MDSEPIVTLVLFPLTRQEEKYAVAGESTSYEPQRKENCRESQHDVNTCQEPEIGGLSLELIKVDREEAKMLELTELRQGLDPYCIRKTLTGSDLGNMSRLMLAAEGIESHVFPFWNADQLAKIKEGLSVSVWDGDTQTEHELVFKRWNKRANVLIKNWVKDFVRRRELKLGDEIGLYWDTCNSRFQFAVLNRVARN
ncbi:B3 domain-containing protein At2g33720-like [Herrania umbratica]|uniref:B3 domain-containing protein At2g33720-like n=1 Tax=Herrania umbratica TaxID=108875 RepID=A0A6J0ZK94_9ROSI|nr:B3 domain-containing protein At2g33720-like [Herrania umbratica]